MNAMVNDVHSAIQIIKAVADAIKEVGRIPNGHLYAQLLGVMTLGQYQSIIGTLKGAGLIEEKNNELIWIVV